MPPRISVLMPTYGQAPFIRRAIESLLAQRFTGWECIVVDDGSRDDTASRVSRYLGDPRISYHQVATNRGLGAALNYALDRACAPLIAYLPSDDVYFSDHLQSLFERLEPAADAVLAYSGVRHHYNKYEIAMLPGKPLQLVQVLHRRTDDRWTTREEVVTDDLDRMFWSKLRTHGRFVPTRTVTSEWVDHPRQRHKIVQDPEGGLNAYRQYYRVPSPVRIETTTGSPMDESRLYARYARTAPSNHGLKIVLAGELAYNPDRVIALEERGHRLYGLWMRDPFWYNTVGPLPFGRVEDIPEDDWPAQMRRIAPDVIYALLNWQAVPFVHDVLRRNPGVPFVWHFKEGPFICLEKGTWSKLVDLYCRANAHIYSSPEMRDWFHTVLPQTARKKPSMVLDGDLPKQDWFLGKGRAKLSASDGAIHTVVPGRPIGLHPSDIAELAGDNVHVHIYGEFTHRQWLEWVEKGRRLAPKHLHLHSHVEADNWVAELSQYDAGWLHYFESENNGEITRANWDDLNYPARMSTLACAGLPFIQRDNTGSIVAVQSLAKRLGVGLFASSMKQLAGMLHDSGRMKELQGRLTERRLEFTFDHHCDHLVDFLRESAKS